MLVLTRKKNQKIMIGDDVELTIVDIKSEQIKIGVNAPDHIKVFRKEVYDAIQAENLQAAKETMSGAKYEGLADLFRNSGK
jgi:carbon storage regulator